MGYTRKILIQNSVKENLSDTTYELPTLKVRKNCEENDR